MLFFNVESIFNGILTAYARAVGVVLVSGSDTLNHHHGVEFAFGHILQILGELDLGHHPLIFFVTVFRGLVFLGAGCQDHHTVLDFSFVHARTHQNLGCKVALESVKSHDQRLGQHLNLLMVGDPFDEIIQKGP